MAEDKQPATTENSAEDAGAGSSSAAAAAGDSASCELRNAPPAVKSSAGGWTLNLLIVAAFALFAFSGFWLYQGYRRQANEAQIEQMQREQRQAVLQGALGPDELQPAADTALKFLTARPEFTAEVGELLKPDQPVEYRMQLTDELGRADDVKFRMTLRGAKSHAWYDTILRQEHGEWRLLSAALTVPDRTQPEGRRVVKLLEPPPPTPPAGEALQAP